MLSPLILLSALVSLAVCAPQPVVKVMHAPEVDISMHFEPASSLNATKSNWMMFKSKFEKKYATKEEEEKRRTIYETNLKKIELHNYLYRKGLCSFAEGENKYSDMEHGEFVRIMNGYKPQNKTLKGRLTYVSPLAPLDCPDAVDWRTQGYVTDVKDQGQCGSCWAFSTTGSLEGQTMRSTGQLVPLSEQNLVDCAGPWGDEGCGGGWMDSAFQYISDNGGLDTEDCYPYEAMDDQCRYSPDCTVGHDSGFTDLPAGDEDALKERVASVGPISVAIDASDDSFMHYQGGMYNNPDCGTQPDHAVLVVGYGTCDDDFDYWIVKNSWGTSWGDAGYIYMARNQGNQCGIANYASYPNV